MQSSPLGLRRDRPPRAPSFGVAVLAALVLVFGLGVTAVHHHEREDGTHPCAICSLGHAPATVAADIGAAAPHRRIERIAPAPLASPRSAGPASPKSRAPPST